MFSFTAVFALLCVANVIVARDALDCVETAKRWGAINFISALSESALTDAVRGLGTSTLFVPTNNAFLSLSDKLRNEYQNNSKIYQETIKNHIITGTSIAYDKFFDEHEYNTLAENAQVRANSYDTSFTDKTQFKTINGARMSATKRDIPCGNGVTMHFVDELITSIATSDLLTLIKNNASFTSFLSVYNAANATGKDLLNQTEGETVFIPDNAAFAKLPNDTLPYILKNIDVANDVIAAHVVSSESFFSVSLWDKRTLTTADKRNLTIAYDPKVNRITINGAAFVDVDIAAKNGVYHIVDTVLWTKILFKTQTALE